MGSFRQSRSRIEVEVLESLSLGFSRVLCLDLRKLNPVAAPSRVTSRPRSPVPYDTAYYREGPPVTGQHYFQKGHKRVS